MAELHRGDSVRARYTAGRIANSERNAMARVVQARRVRTCDCCWQVIGYGELYLSVNAFNTESVCTRCVTEGRCTIIAEEGAR